MRLSCTLAVGALAVATKQTCAFQVRGPAIVPTSAKTSFTSSASAITGRHAAAAAPARGNRNVLQASLNMPGSEWARTRAERVKSALVLKSAADASATPAAGGATPAAPAKEKTSTLKVGFYLFVWYSLTIGYNIYNKATLNRMNIPWILSTVQLAVGTIYVSLVWALGIRKAPKLSASNLKAVVPLAALHTTSHIAAVVGLSAGAIGFVQIVKVSNKGVMVAEQVEASTAAAAGKRGGRVATCAGGGRAKILNAHEALRYFFSLLKNVVVRANERSFFFFFLSSLNKRANTSCTFHNSFIQRLAC